MNNKLISAKKKLSNSSGNFSIVLGSYKNLDNRPTNGWKTAPASFIHIPVDSEQGLLLCVMMMR
jgi:pyrrolidone-carboxylate peptidase